MRRFTPVHLQIIRLYWNCLSPKEIADVLNVSEATVSSIIGSEIGQEILNMLIKKTLDTMADVQSTAQAIAPAVMEEKIRLALYGADERVKNSACKELLEIAGHAPVKRLQVSRPDHIAEKYEDMSESELREELRKGILPSGNTADDITLH